MMRAILLILVLLALPAAAPDNGPPAVVAVDPETKSAVLSLLRLMGTEEKMARMINIMKPGVTAIISQKLPGPDAQKLVDEIILPEMRAHLGSLLDMIADAYAEHFTLAEISEIRAFFETPIGHKWLDEQESLSTGTQKLGTIWAQRVLPEILRNHADELAAMASRAQQRSVNPGSPPRP
jgi:hypothetical protein